MKKNKRNIMLGTVAGIALLAIGIVGLFFRPGSAMAQGAPNLGGFGDRPMARMGGFGRGEAGGRGALVDRTTLDQAIADALGMTIEELEAAYADGVRWPVLADERGIDTDVVNEAIHNATVAGLNAAVADGTITQAQADTALERAELHYLAQIVVDRSVVQQAVADTLGLTLDELNAAHAAGTRLPELAAAAGVTVDDVRAAADAARKAQIEQAVADGVLTAEQAEQLESMPMRGGRHHGGMGGPGGFGDGGGRGECDGQGLGSGMPGRGQSGRGGFGRGQSGTGNGPAFGTGADA